MKTADLYEAVTQSIIADLEKGVASWVKPWKSGGGVMPFNYATKREYSGINIPILWHAAHVRGYGVQGWLTYKQALAAGGQVRGGEKGTTIVFTKKLMVKQEEADEEKQIAMLRAFTVFNVAQIDGLTQETVEVPLLPGPKTKAYDLIMAAKPDIRHGGGQAFYRPKDDFIMLPEASAFETYEHYLATALHELCHWSGAKHRLDRDLSGRFGTQSYAAEELVAELGAAFLCAHTGVQGQLRHAEYLASWLKLLKEDSRAIFTAASKASQAADYLRAFSQPIAQAA